MLFDYTIPVLERIKFPLLWEKLPCGVQIEDLQEDKFEEATNHLREYFIYDNPMLKACDLASDAVSVNNFISLTRYWMQDTQSFIAVEEETKKIVGVLIGRANDLSTHLKTMSRMSIYEGNILQKIQRFRMHLHKEVNIFELYDTPAYFRIYVWSVATEFRGKGIGKALLKASIEQTKLFKMKVLMGIFTGIVSQNIATKFGFQSQLEILYSQWVEEDEVVFENPGPANYSANVMAFTIELAEEIMEVEEATQEKTSSASNGSKN